MGETLMDIFVVLIVGLFFAWLANIFIEGHGLGYALNLLVATVGSFVGLIIYKNITIPIHSFWGSLSSCFIGSLVFLTPIMIYSSNRKAL